LSKYASIELRFALRFGITQNAEVFLLVRASLVLHVITSLL